MNRITALAIATLAACATHPPGLCTEEDQQAGTCSGPAGGWTALRQRTQDTAVQVDPAAAGGADTLCSTNTDGTKYCTLSVSLPGHWLLVTCWETSPGGSVSCTWTLG